MCFSSPAYLTTTLVPLLQQTMIRQETFCSYTGTITDLNEIQIFVAVVREQSFTRAARVLEISKAASSRAIANLEKRLAARLFERTTRRIRLTEAGEIYHGYALRVMEGAEEGEAAVLKLGEQPRGTLRVAMPVTMAQSSVAPRLTRFLETYPELKLDIVLKGGQLDPIAQRVDVAFQTTRPETDSAIIQRRILTTELGIFGSRKYLAAAPALRTPHDLAQHSCMTMNSTRAGSGWNLHRGGKVEEVRVRSRIAIGDPVVHCRLCMDGMGIAILPVWLVRREDKREILVRVLPGWMPSPVELYVLYPTRLSMTPKLNAFLKFIESVLP